MTGLPDLSLARAWLFVPGTRPERFAKAVASGADEVILDLEDAVAAADKAAAREHCVAWLREGGSAWVRVNGTDTPWHAEDVAALASLSPGALRGIVVPKADRAALEEVARLAPATVLLALVETARGLRDAGDLAEHASVAALAFGSLDYAVDLGVGETGPALDFARNILVVAARAAGLSGPIDGVTADVADPAVARADAETARRLGFAAKLCIHPAQVAPVQAAFAPGEQELAWARTVVERAADLGAGVIEVDGRMVDRPVLLRAEQILARAAAPAARRTEGAS